MFGAVGVERGGLGYVRGEQKGEALGQNRGPKADGRARCLHGKKKVTCIEVG
jgi:hypothetical protein